MCQICRWIPSNYDEPRNDGSLSRGARSVLIQASEETSLSAAESYARTNTRLQFVAAGRADYWAPNDGDGAVKVAAATRAGPEVRAVERFCDGHL